VNSAARITRRGNSRPRITGAIIIRAAHELDGGRRCQAGADLRATDEFGYNVVENPVDVHDFQATILHQLGIDHERLTFKAQGRDFRLTDVHGKVVKAILA
jgi:hypothetical protein